MLAALHEDGLGDILHEDTVNPVCGEQGVDVLQEEEEDTTIAVEQVLDALHEDVMGEVRQEDGVNHQDSDHVACDEICNGCASTYNFHCSSFKTPQPMGHLDVCNTGNTDITFADWVHVQHDWKYPEVVMWMCDYTTIEKANPYITATEDSCEFVKALSEETVERIDLRRLLLKNKSVT